VTLITVDPFFAMHNAFDRRFKSATDHRRSSYDSFSHSVNALTCTAKSLASLGPPL
jgi:hypothetical protein